MRRRSSGRAPALGLVLGWTGAAAALGLLVFAGVSLARLRAVRASIDPDSLCPAGTPPAIIAVLVDSSDALSALQQTRIRQLLDRELAHLPRGARVDVYRATARAGALAKPLFRKCAPAPASAAQSGWSENPQSLQKLRRERFEKPLQAALAQAMKASPRPVSPILETIAAASTQSFGSLDLKDPSAQAPALRMIIISDFLQNSPLLVQYRPYPDIAEFSRSPAWTATRPVLDGVRLTLLYISRPESMTLQNERHRLWWCSYFKMRGAAACRMERI